MIGLWAEGFSGYQPLTVRELTLDTLLDYWQNCIAVMILTTYWVMKSRRIREARSAYRVLEGKLEGKRLLGQPRCR
jgi:hypothetical protein